MDDFRKLIYKNPELQRTVENEISSEELEYSEKIAKEKLNKILNPDFREFSVRYMNIEEYRNILEQEEIKNEISVYGDELSPFKGNVKDFLADASLRVEQHTNWDLLSGDSKNEIDSLIRGIKSIELKNKTENNDKKMQLIRDYIITELSGPWGREDVSGLVDRYIDPKIFLDNISFLSTQEKEEIKTEFTNRTKKADTTGQSYLVDNFIWELRNKYNLNNEQKKILKNYLDSLHFEFEWGRENIRVIKEFKEDNNFLKNKDNLRRLIHSIGYFHDQFTESDSRAYNLAVIFDNKTFKIESGEWIYGWSYLHSEEIKKLTSQEKGKGILGAISIIPLKEVYKEMIDLEKGSGDFAHPIFDNRGDIKWPK